MSDLSLTKIKCQMLNLIGKAKYFADKIQIEIKNLPPHQSSVVITKIDFETNLVDSYDGIVKDAALSIYGNFTYKIDQDSKSAFRRPGIVQCSPECGQALKEALDGYNKVKAEIKYFHVQMQENMSLEQVKSTWQSACSMLTLKQLFRQVHYLESDIMYAGISVVTKPVVTKVSKDQIIKTIDAQLKTLPYGVDPVQHLELLKEKKSEISSLSEQQYSFRMARRGAPRPVVNLKTVEGRTKQLMASMPVVVFTNDLVSVSLPRAKKVRSRRSDAFLTLAENGAHMQLNIHRNNQL